MGDVDEGAGTVGEVVLGTVMAEIGCDVGIGTGCLAQERIPRSPAYGDCSDGPLGVARYPHAMPSSRQ